ncbi:tautomerase family protein [Mycetocola tolaasinivorans]|uniref:Tautomerase family protein n=1 Tax=Mycetocola tolaasinivorans TaxID=76635 RepID=A0A3L7A6Q4_9MICO|nr:tautomerase family protein [Mycetocola tolaasinivorans]RLP76013.1 tautomerase family protein [Mycetocola tolaasinivorans]
MAQIIIYGLADTLRPRRQALSDAIHAAAVRELGLPETKRFHRFITLEREDFFTPADRSENYTIIEVSLFAGRSVDTRKRFIHELFERVSTDVGIDPQDLEITLTETPRENWGIRGTTGDELALSYAIEPGERNEPETGAATADTRLPSDTPIWFAEAPLSGERFEVFSGDRFRLGLTRERTSIKIANEYGVDWPLWGPEGLTVESQFPQISDALRARLKAWAHGFNTLYHHDHGWGENIAHAEAHAAEGGILAMRVTEELGQGFSVSLNIWETTV